MTNQDNRIRVFAEVVTVDAWHKAFDGNTGEAELHADVVFGTGRIGGETESKVRFRLSLLRAEVIVVIPQHEPGAVDPQNVTRDAPEMRGKLTQKIAQSGRIEASIGGSANLSPTGATTSLRANAEAEAKLSTSTDLELTADVVSMLVTQSKSPDGNYRWAAEPTAGKILKGRPWDSNVPRLTVRDKRSDRNKGLPPIVRVEVRCKREDLLIEDIELKDDNGWKKVTLRSGHKNRVAAAESYIRSKLAEIGLEVGNIEDKFGGLTLASVTAQPT